MNIYDWYSAQTQITSGAVTGSISGLRYCKHLKCFCCLSITCK